jgi:membrane fusion protein, multidrug efflux system
MKTLKIIISIIVISLIAFSCSTDKHSQLTKLRQEQTVLAEKIRNLENELKDERDSVDVTKFKFVGVTDIKTEPFDHFIRVQGKLDGDYNAAVFAEAPGTIVARYADVGHKVAKGQVLAQIDDQQYRGQLENLETQYNLALDLFEKQQRLWDQRIGSEVQYLQAKSNKESLELQISTLKQQIDKFKIKSPIRGVIEEVNIKVGGVVSPDPRLAAFRVISFEDMKVSAEVSEAYSSRVQAGDKLIVQFPDLNKETQSKVDFVSRYINPVNRTFIIETGISEKIENLKANMIAIIRINDYHAENAILLPMNVIQTDLSGSYVYIIGNKDKYNAAYKQPVVIGNSYNGMAEIIGGLSVGDKVVSTGFQELIDGEYVRF